MHVNDIKSDKLNKDIMYIIGSPEDFIEKKMFERFKKEDLQNSITAIIADEAHCSVTWSEDFRPKFGELSKLRSIFPTVPFLAMTGTATPEMIKAIQSSLRLREAEIVKTPVDRPNITLQVIQRAPNSGKHTLEEIYDDIITPYMTRLAAEKWDFPKTIVFTKLQWIAHGDNLSMEIPGAEDHSSQYHAPLSDQVYTGIFSISNIKYNKTEILYFIKCRKKIQPKCHFKLFCLKQHDLFFSDKGTYSGRIFSPRWSSTAGVRQ